MIHTQDPWEIRKGTSVTYIMGKDANGHDVPVASVFPRGAGGCETEGNAHLLKAAPEMAELIAKVMRQRFVFFPEDRKEAKAVLAEVEGRENETNLP